MTENKKENMIILVDVGALGGVSTKWKNVEYKAVLFEPGADAKIKNRSNWLVLPVALSDRKGQQNLYVTKKRSCSSLYEPNHELLEKYSNSLRFEVVEKVNIDTDTLDNQLLENKIGDVDVIKLDVQGGELSVLKGATRSLAKTVAVEIEVAFVPMYKDQPLFGEVDSFLRDKGFDLIKFTNLEEWKNGKRTALIWGDAVYLKRLESLSMEKRYKLKIIKSILLKRTRNLWSMVSIKRKIKSILKFFLFKLGASHPSEGKKISQIEKAELILQNKPSDVHILVETGTREGWMIERLGRYFEQIYSVELDENLYTKAVKKFTDQENVKIWQGDSAKRIKEILGEINSPAVFWLDAHDEGVITSQNSPIISELNAIFSHSLGNHTVLVDDARHFDRKTIRMIKNLSAQNGYTFVIENGIFILYGTR